MSDIPTTKKEREMMEHALGIQVKAGQKTKGGYRNYFAAGPSDHWEWDSLVERGLAEVMTGDANSRYYKVTELGKAQL